VDESGSLENCRARKGSGGSNPSPTAKYFGAGSRKTGGQVIVMWVKIFTRLWLASTSLGGRASPSALNIK
jgi:hypothetical protein